MSVQRVPVDHLEENTWNPNVMDPEKFEALKVDVVAGEYNPVDVSPKDVFYGDPELPGDRYVIVNGAHRWLAAVEGDVGDIAIDVKPMTEAEAKAYNYARNWISGSMDPIKEAALFQSEIDAHDFTQEQIAEKYHRSRAHVSNRLRLLNISEPVKKLYREPEKFEELLKVKVGREIVEANPQETYTEEQLEEMVEVTMEDRDIAPRGALTDSHLEAIAVLGEEAQADIATKIVEENLTVRDTERLVRVAQEDVARRIRFEAALERAKQKTCPECGAPPSDFEEKYRYMGQEGPREFDEEVFQCSASHYHDWPYMRRAPSKEKKLEAERKERSEKQSAAGLNPKYIRREEEMDDLIESMRPWVQRQIAQLDEIERVSIKGLRGDKVITIDFPSNYGSKLFFRIGDSGADKWHDRFHSMAEKSFGFNIEKKIYKSLPFKSKLDLSQGPSPKHRAQVHHFLDHIIKTNLDPFLPEEEDILQDILRKYGELEELDDVDIQAEEDLQEADELGYTETDAQFDTILDAFLEGEHDLMRIQVTGFDAEDTVDYFEMRISARAITGNVEVYEADDGEVYLERLKSKVEEAEA